MTNLIIRKPVSSDADAISAIDAEGLATGDATFRDTPHSSQSFSSSFQSARGLALVAEENGVVIAWAGVGPTSARAVYRGVGEISIYVMLDCQGRGVGQRLLNRLIQLSEDAGYWTLVAQVFPENKASVSLHKAAGFDVIGIRRKLGKMTYGPFNGRWRDVVMLERRSNRIG